MTKDQRIKKECEKCGKEFLCSPSHAGYRKNCSLYCSNHGRQKNTGRTHFKKGELPWNKDKSDGIITKAGYRMIRIDDKYIMEHRLVWCSQPENLKYIPEGFHIHHGDGNKLNNDPDNLFLMTEADHESFHSQIKYPKGSYLGKNINIMKGGLIKNMIKEIPLSAIKVTKIE